jgi:hypothetical protein
MTDEERERMRAWVNNWKEVGEVMERISHESILKSFNILTDLRGMWVATPWNYNSSRWIRFHDNNSAELCFGYGQTIYAVIKANFEITKEHILNFTYLESPAVAFFKGFIPDNERKELFFTLLEETNNFMHQITGQPKIYRWKLTLDRSAFPDSLKFPYEIPLEFYGHRICE